MQLIYEHTFNGHIWRVIPDKNLPFLVIEVREEKQKEVFFFSLFLNKTLTLVPLLTKKDGLNWWTGVSGVGFGKIFLHKFLQPDIPTPSGIFCYELKNGKKLWEIEHFLFNRILNDKLLVISNLIDNTENLLEVEDGVLIDEKEASNLSSSFINDTENLLLPINYKEDNLHFQTISQFICIKTGLVPVKQIEYIESNTLIIVCFYTYKKELHLQHHLYVWDASDGRLLHTDILKEQANGVGLDIIMLLNEKLVYIKNVNLLKIYEN